MSLKDFISRLFLYKEESMDDGFKYLGFHLKPNGYRTKYCESIIKRIQWIINNLTFCWLSLGGRITLVTFVLQGIHVYWFSLFLVLASIISRIRENLLHFMWSGRMEFSKVDHSSWESVSLCHGLGGWGIKILWNFNLSLCVKK